MSRFVVARFYCGDDLGNPIFGIKCNHISNMTTLKRSENNSFENLPRLYMTSFKVGGGGKPG